MDVACRQPLVSSNLFYNAQQPLSNNVYYDKGSGHGTLINTPEMVGVKLAAI
jgi:hypothetical protein